MIKVQTFREVREATGRISEQALHTIFAMLFDGDMAPSGSAEVPGGTVSALAVRLGGDERAFLEAVVAAAIRPQMRPVFTVDLEDRQTVFNTVVAHLAQQKQRSVKGGICQYWQSDGLRCAIGTLLNNHDDGWEGESVCELLRLKDGAVSDESIQLLSDLQDAHDMCTDPMMLCRWLRDTAETFGLDDSAVETITAWAAA